MTFNLFALNYFTPTCRISNPVGFPVSPNPAQGQAASSRGAPVPCASPPSSPGAFCGCGEIPDSTAPWRRWPGRDPAACRLAAGCRHELTLEPAGREERERGAGTSAWMGFSVQRLYSQTLVFLCNPDGKNLPCLPEAVPQVKILVIRVFP